jgi:hypothetical protein
MSLASLFFDCGKFLMGEDLKSDGSNFIDWYKRLRDTLKTNFMLEFLDEPMRERPDDSADEYEEFDYQTHVDKATSVQCVMLFTMEPDLHQRFRNTEAYPMISELKELFIEQVRILRFEQLDKFLSLRMEENTCLRSHLKKMYDIYEYLVTGLNYWMSEIFAREVVLRSLPPSYKDVVNSYVMKGDIYVPFFKFMVKLANVKVEPIAGEVVDPAGIFDIQVINDFLTNTYSN